MRKLIRHTIEALFWVAIVGLGLGSCSAQRPKCGTEFSFKESKSAKLPSLIREFSEERGTSVLAEINDDSKQIDVPAGDYTLQELLQRFDLSLRCESVNEVLHIFDENVLASAGNALNYRFAFFEIPPNIERFQITLKERLMNEAFAHPQPGKTVIQSLGGGMTGNSVAYPLEEASIRDVQARTLLFTVASKYTMASIICFPKERTRLTDPAVWKFATTHWSWTLNDNARKDR